MSRPSFHVKKGDEVVVITGSHKEARGKILQVLPKKSQVLIEGVRLIKKHQRKSQDHPQGAIIEREGPIHVSNVMKVEDWENSRAARARAAAGAAKPAAKSKAAKK